MGFKTSKLDQNRDTLNTRSIQSLQMESKVVSHLLHYYHRLVVTIGISFFCEEIGHLFRGLLQGFCGTLAKSRLVRRAILELKPDTEPQSITVGVDH
jgi:hypothetical protein